MAVAYGPGGGEMLNRSMLSKPTTTSEDLTDYIKSETTTGEHKITNIKMDEEEKISVKYESAAHE